MRLGQLLSPRGILAVLQKRIEDLTAGEGCTATVDCSGSAAGRSVAVRAT